MEWNIFPLNPYVVTAFRLIIMFYNIADMSPVCADKCLSKAINFAKKKIKLKRTQSSSQVSEKSASDLHQNSSNQAGLEDRLTVFIHYRHGDSFSSSSPSAGDPDCFHVNQKLFRRQIRSAAAGGKQQNAAQGKCSYAECWSGASQESKQRMIKLYRSCLANVLTEWRNLHFFLKKIQYKRNKYRENMQLNELLLCIQCQDILGHLRYLLMSK